MKSNIKILIACHKPSELPHNDLFLPVRVGAALHDDNMGLQRDDDGKDNISKKNPGYCELTAIYWAWKNLDADYYGLFHYRRFYSFADKQFPVSEDGHMMIRARILCQEVFDKYKLNDEAQMRRIIESNDLIIHKSRPVRGIPTPTGIPGQTVREHYRQHDGTIIRDSDIELMLAIVRSKFPKEYLYINDYMNGHKFLGYNMFIMKKPYFQKMCKFTFGVLSEAEKTIEPTLPERSVNGNRIYGYLAEILTSAYIYYLRKTNSQLKVKELQMIYALKTDPIKEIVPVKGAVPIIIDLTSNVVPNLNFYTENIVRQLVSSKGDKTKYDVIIGQDNILSKAMAKICESYSTSDVSVRVINYGDYLDRLRETYGIQNVGMKLVLPYLLSGYQKVISLSWNMWVDGGLSSLYTVDVSGCYGAAAKNVRGIGEMREVSVENKRSIAMRLNDDYDISPNDLFDDSVMLINLKEIRKKYTLDDIIKRHAQMHRRYDDLAIECSLYAGGTKTIGQEWNYQIPCEHTMYMANFFAPIGACSEWKSIDKPIISCFENDQLIETSDRFAMKFYAGMTQCQMWPVYVGARELCLAPVQKPMRDRIAPVGSRRRKIAKALFPHGSKRRMLAGKMYRTIAHRR